LDEDRDRAGEKYEEIRSRLIKIFEVRGCPVAEELADATLDRVAGKVRDIVETYVGRPELYFYGVAQKIYLEHIRRRPIQPPAVAQPASEDTARQFDCLEKCLKRLTPKSRRMILRYYEEKGHIQMENRRGLARKMGIGINALRIRAHRVRESLATCLAECLKEKHD
jgi:DNA-directed RNA polymerase specialized sigma24 family protein